MVIESSGCRILTAQSLEGRDIYHALSRHTEVSLFQPQACDAPLLQEIYLVDFHRLTVWFALLQATRSSTQHEQERLVEFFTQIIYSPPCQLFLGFHLGEPVAAGMVTEHEHMVLLSDLVVKPNLYLTLAKHLLKRCMRNGKPSPRVMLPLTSNFEPLSVRKE